jgi:hypothetical protein
MSVFEQQLQQFKTFDCAPWDKIQRLGEALRTNSDHILNLISAIRGLYERDISRVKTIMQERARHCDLVVARLQYIEMQDYRRSGKVVDVDTTNPEESLLAKALSDGCQDNKIFSVDPPQVSRWFQLSAPIGTTCHTSHHDEGSHTTFPDLLLGRTAFPHCESRGRIEVNRCRKI